MSLSTATPAVKPRRAVGTHLPTLVFESSEELSHHVAQIVAGVIRERNAQGQNAVLGLPTGSSPVGVYRELVRMHREEGLDFSHVVTFVLNEFYGLAADQLQSHHRWMREHLLDQVNIPPAQRPHSRRHRTAWPRSKPIAASLKRRSSGPAGSMCCSWASAATATSAATSRFPASAGGRGSARSTRSRGGPWRATFSASGTCPRRRSRWAWARFSTPAKSC